jgi:hypothetical protein
MNEHTDIGAIAAGTINASDIAFDAERHAGNARRQLLERQWSRLTTLTADVTVERLGQRDDGARHALMLQELRFDKSGGIAPDRTTVLGMFRAPASKDRHHNYEGGLVHHLLEMWDIWLTDGAHIIRQYGKPHPLLNDSNIWRVILYHDLNKVWRYQLMQDNPMWRVDFAKRDDKLAQLVGHHKTFWFLHKHEIKMTLPVYNALLCAEGGYNEHRPPVETVLAKIVYLLDELSANVVDRLNTNRFWDSKAGGVGEET